MTKKVSKILLYSILSIVLLVGSLAIYTQTSAFRSNVRSILYKVVKSNLNASVYFGEIKGNFVSGFSIDTLMVYVDNQPFVETGKIAVRYDLFKLLGNTVSVDSVTISNPVIHLFRSKDSSWNVNRLVVEKPAPDSSVSPVVLDVKSLHLTNGEFSLIDSTGDINSSVTIDNRKSINYSNMFFRKIFLNARASYSAKNISANIEQLALESPREQFTLSKLSTEVQYSQDTASVKDLDIVTPLSHIAMSARLSGVDVMKIKDLKDFRDVPTTAAVSSSTVAMQDLQTFLPVLYFIKGKVYVDASFQGTFEQLNVKKLDASFAKTTVHLSGFVSNIHQPNDLRLNIISKQSTIMPMDVPQLLPFFRIPEYKDLGLLTVDFQFVGKPLDFMAVTTVTSSAGLVSVDGEMLITEDNIHYKGLISGKNVNLEKVFSMSDLASQLNAKTYVEARGTSIDNLQGEAKIEIDSSIIRGIPVSSAALTVKAGDKKIHSALTLASPDGTIKTDGTIDFNHPSPSYAVTASARNVNFAPFIGDEYYNSRMSFDLVRSAEKFDLLDGVSTTHVTVLPSVFRQYAIDSSTIDVNVKTDSLQKRTITIQSPMTDGTISGFFTVQGLINTLTASIREAHNVYSYQRQVVDSGFIASHDSVAGTVSDTSHNEIDYRFLIKNLTPLAVGLKLPAFDASGSLEGRLTGNAHNAAWSGRVELGTLSFFHDSTNIQGRQVSLDYSLENREYGRSTGPLPNNFRLQSQSSELLINNALFRNMAVGVIVQDTSGNFSFQSDIDTTISLGIQGDLVVQNDREKFNFTKFLTTYQGFGIENRKPIVVELNSKGVRVDSAVFIHRNQTLSVNGFYTYDGIIKAAATIDNFDFSDIRYFNSSDESREKLGLLGGTIRARAELSGTISDPVFSVQARGDSVSYENKSLGNLSAVLKYAQKLASVNVQISSKGDSDSTPGVTLQGSIPVDLSLRNVPERMNRPGLDLKLTSSKLFFSALDPFIPELITTQGVIKSDLAITGSLKNPVFHGTANLDGGQFVLEMNGLTYDANGVIVFDSNRVSFPSFTVGNLISDYSPGKMNVSGYILLSGFVPNEYHLRAHGDLKVLSEASKTTGSKFFGTIVASTGNDSIRFDGTFERSRVKGIVYIEQASLTFPQTQQASNYSASDFGTVEFVDDTSRPVVDTLLIARLMQAIHQAKILPTINGRTFLDGFGYDLTIQSSNSMQVNMIFNQNAGSYEELYAILTGKLVLTKDENGLQLKGTINVGNGSYYDFYKRFNATGALTFLGDPQNPQLDIAATYEGTHVPDPKNAPNVEERAVVTLNITGNRTQPKIKLGLKTIDKTGKETERTGDVENDAIAFLLTSSPGVPGKFREELTADDRNRISDQLTSTIGGTFVNNLLSGYVMGFIQNNNIPFVQSFTVRKVIEATPEINIGANIMDAYVNVGGQVFSNPNNANISVQIPLGDRQKRNFMLEVEKKTENYDYSNQARTIIDARIFYRFTF